LLHLCIVSPRRECDSQARASIALEFNGSRKRSQPHRLWSKIASRVDRAPSRGVAAFIQLRSATAWRCLDSRQSVPLFLGVWPPPPRLTAPLGLVRGFFVHTDKQRDPLRYPSRPEAGAHIGEASGAGFAISGRSRAFDHPSPGAVPPVIFLTSRAAHAHFDLWKRIKYHGFGVQTGGNWLTGGRTPNEDVACCAVFR